MLNLQLPQQPFAFQGFPSRPSCGCGAGGSNQMMMMLQMMMGIMTQMMGRMMSSGMPFPMSPANFGQGGIPGFGQGGSPLNSFLGGQAQGGGQNSGVSGGQGLYNGPAGTVGNVNVESLVNAVDPSYRKAARQHWPHIVSEAQKQGISNKAQLAYILATTVHESGAGAHMEEFASGRAYEGRRDLGNSQPGDGTRYKGRGYVQITGRTNYRDWSKRLGIDLVGNPDAAKNPATAAKILVGGMKMGTFTGKKLDDYINGSKTDFTGARRIVNGTDKAGTFAQTAQRILAAMG
jgi:predicted chitinase